MSTKDMTHADAIELIKQCGGCVRLLVKRGGKLPQHMGKKWLIDAFVFCSYFYSRNLPVLFLLFSYNLLTFDRFYGST